VDGWRKERGRKRDRRGAKRKGMGDKVKMHSCVDVWLGMLFITKKCITIERAVLGGCFGC